MKIFKVYSSALLIVLGTLSLSAQNQPVFSNNQLKFNMNEDGSHYIQMTGLLQTWFRGTQMNPGTTISGYSKDSYTDLSIRRLRFQTYGQLTDRVFFYAQFGQNNFNFHSNKYDGAFFHDAIGEFAVVKQKLSIGGGLTGWSGLARYASPSVASILTLDAPLYQQATNGVNDQFLRKLSLYAKGQLGKLDYRIAVTQPMTVTGTPNAEVSPTSTQFTFSNEPPKKQLQGYVKYMFLDSESNLTPYSTGSYLGRKSVFNIGAGVIFQKDAMWALNDAGATVHSNMALYGLDVYYDKPISETAAITAYAALTNYDFGSGYIRNIGVNNPATGLNAPNPGGAGNAFPMVGTGNTVYAQLGYLFGQNMITEGGQLQPFAAVQLSGYDHTADNVTMFELGGNYFIHGSHSNKISAVYQNRPVFVAQGGENIKNGSKGMFVLQYQVSF
ncbi:MAG: hypothetical protein ACMVP2_02885 [Imperialibacter sp.]|uniref:hypothetical protein n=1 Tax=Imperialibacter sp. TaxID=2038411 RepID=UPI003A873647